MEPKELSHPFAQVFDNCCCQYRILKQQTDKVSQRKAPVYRSLDSLIRLQEDTIYDMFDELIAHHQDGLLEEKYYNLTSPDVQRIIHWFVKSAGANLNDYGELNEQVYYDFKWAFVQYKKNGGRATRSQWTHGGPRDYN